jgi:arylsulfatase A-like enzyme
VGGKFTLYQPGVRIPFVMQWKNHIPAGTTVDALAQTIDLAPTLFDYAGIEPPASMVRDGRSLTPVVDGDEEEFDHRELYFEFGYHRGLRFGKWKYIAWRLPERMLEQMKQGEVEFFDTLGKPIDPENIRPTVVVPTVPRHPHFFEADQLYDLENDPDEKENLAESPEHAATLTEMRERLQTILDTFDHPFNVTEPRDPFYSSDQFKQTVASVRETYDKLHDDWIKHKGRIYGFVNFVGK